MSLDRADEQQRTLARALRRADLSVKDLWIRYFALGGDAGELDVDGYVHGLTGLAEFQRDILAHAVNERLDELTWSHRAAYSRTTREGRPRTRALAALVELLEGAELAPPDRLSAVTQAAADALDVRITMYLVDYDQRELHAVPPATGSVPVDDRQAGLAFREVRIVAGGDGQPRLWVPLLDGVERLGVLDVEFVEEADLHNPGLRTQCRWVSMLLGHLVTLLTQYGDALDGVRMRRERPAASELVWSLLPPLTARVDDFVVAGALEPRYEGGANAFDYALSENTASLMILDAAGDQQGTLVAATAIAAYRSARHAGHGLVEQACLIDHTITAQFGEDSSVAAVLAEIDLRTGRLCYLNAGHPPPLLLRAGTAATSLTGARRGPLGREGDPVPAAEETLRPHDALLLHTAGVTAARDQEGEPFGDARLAEALRRETAAGTQPAETTRRLIQAVAAHSEGHENAAVVLARWTSAPTMGQ